MFLILLIYYTFFVYTYYVVFFCVLPIFFDFFSFLYTPFIFLQIMLQYCVAAGFIHFFITFICFLVSFLCFYDNEEFTPANWKYQLFFWKIETGSTTAARKGIRDSNQKGSDAVKPGNRANNGMYSAYTVHTWIYRENIVFWEHLNKRFIEMFWSSWKWYRKQTKPWAKEWSSSLR